MKEMAVSEVEKDRPVIAWWSGGVTSAVTCKICIDWYGVDNVRVVFIDTKNEDQGTYQFLKECENWYGRKIEPIFNPEYDSIEQVWYKFESLNTANGAICSTELKRKVREQFQKENKYSYQAFGYECEMDEINRARAMKLNYPETNPIFPLISELLTKKDCIKIIENSNDLFLSIHIPASYKNGYLNNNCFETGCVQGGIGYWQKMKRDSPEKFYRMAKREHYLTDKKGQPVTILKDQSKGGGLVFLLPHPQYPHMKDISMMKGRVPSPLMECNGFCGTNDLVKKKFITEIL